MHRLLAGVLLALVPAFALAEPAQFNGPLTLRQAVARAQVAGFDVQFAEADALGARAQAATARAALLPQVALSGTTLNAHLPQLGMPVARQTYLSATASIPILLPSALLANRGAASGELAAAAQTDEARNDAAYVVIQLYHRAQLADALIASRTAAFQAQQSHLRQAELRVAAGKVARYTLARDRAESANSQRALQDAIADREQAYNDLRAALDYRIDSRLTLADSLQADATPVSEDVALRRAATLRPAVVSALRQLDAAHERTRAAKAAYLPSLSGNAQTYSGSSSPDLGSTGYQFGLTATLPIIDGNRTAAISGAKSEEVRAQSRYEQTALFAQRDVANAFSELQAARFSMQSARATLSDAQEQLRIALLREAAGKAINVEVLDALSVAASANEGVLVSIARYNNAVASVQHASGDLAQ